MVVGPMFIYALMNEKWQLGCYYSTKSFCMFWVLQQDGILQGSQVLLLMIHVFLARCP